MVNLSIFTYSDWYVVSKLMFTQWMARVGHAHVSQPAVCTQNVKLSWEGLQTVKANKPTKLQNGQFHNIQHPGGLNNKSRQEEESIYTTRKVRLTIHYCTGWMSGVIYKPDSISEPLTDLSLPATPRWTAAQTVEFPHAVVWYLDAASLTLKEQTITQQLSTWLFKQAQIPFIGTWDILYVWWDHRSKERQAHATREKIYSFKCRK